MSNTLSLHNKRYLNQREFSDQYDSHMSQVACNILFSDPKLLSVYFKTPSLSEDRKLGIDQWIDVERMKISYRIRDAKFKPYFLEGFTIRNVSRFGPTELEKIQTDDYADWLLYAVAHPSEYGVVDCGVLIDLKSVGSQLVTYPHLIEQATKGNGFLEFSYDAFPSDPVVGTYGVKRKEAVPCPSL
ncbi:hypothetical protein C8R31_104284 [Nitrosospira sp. Nsp2]|uniref:hypothetical protein n=1 Tax=Nitrosospira sp. Nsp2 TaxID=136548 RepID=UPI000D308614|nr:hypothetical protein [Nitrosospira sp. Nsp2]PTR15255.1 hypothetical protein C8R31_104284 [Nitrosospira sp. Nsp2]